MLPVNLWYLDPWHVLHVKCYGLGVLAVQYKVQLLPHLLAELLNESPWVERPKVRKGFLGPLRQVLKDGEIHLDELPDIRPLDLEDHLAPVRQLCPVDLAHGCARQGLVVHKYAELVLLTACLLDHLLDILVWDCLHVIREHQQLLDEGRWQHVPPYAEYLPQLHIRWPQLLYGQPDPPENIVRRYIRVLFQEIRSFLLRIELLKYDPEPVL